MSRRVVIVGAGIVGLFSAWFARQRGFDVLVLERHSEHRDGCSFGNAGMLVPSHFVPLAAPGMVALGLKWMWQPESPFYIKPRLSLDLFRWGWHFWRASTKQRVERASTLLRDLHLASRQLYHNLAADWSNSFGLVEQGLLMLCKTQHALDEEAQTAERARQLGIPAQALSPSETQALDPDVTYDILGAVHFPLDCHLVPNRLLADLQARLQQQGVAFAWGSPVLGWETQSGRIVSVSTPTGRQAGDEFVLATGSWSPQVVRELQLRLPIQAGKGYSLTLERPRQLPKLCSILTEARVAITPLGGALRCGGTMEMSGLNETITQRRVQGIVRAVPKYLPALRESDFEGVLAWRGLRPCTPDGLPYLGRSERWANLVIATGHAMMGVSLAPITGQVVASCLAREPVGLDLTLLRPERYG